MPNVISKPQVSRIPYIDLIETVAMFFVVFYHSTFYPYNFLEAEGVRPYIFYYLRGFLSTGVTLFFVVNGYLLFSRPFQWKKHVYKVCKLILVTVVWSVITVFILSKLWGGGMNAFDFVNAVLTWKQGWISYYWYMAALISCYALFPLLKSAYDHCKPAFYFFVIFCFLCTFGTDFYRQVITVFRRVILKDGSGASAQFLLGRFNPFTGTYDYTFVYFCLGGVLLDILPKMQRFKPKHINLAAVICLLVCSAAHFLRGMYWTKIRGNLYDVVFDGYPVVYTLVNTLCIFILCRNYKGRPSKLYFYLSQVSQNTLGIYFTHLTILAAIRQIAVSYPVILSWVETGYIANLIFSFLLLSVAALVCALFRKIPVVRYLFV